MRTKTLTLRTFNGVPFRYFKEINQTRPMWHCVINGRIRASYDTLNECRAAAKSVKQGKA